MTTLRNIVLGCVSDRSQEAAAAATGASSQRTPGRIPKVKFGVPLSEAARNDRLPPPLVDLLVYIAQKGVATTDLFRRPGNTNDAKLITKRLQEGKEVDYSQYNFYTLASVVKKFLLRIPGGVFGQVGEQKLLDILGMENRLEQYDAIHSIILSLHLASQHLLTLLFGTWFRIVTNSEFNTMSSEAVAKSVAGSLFHTCADDPKKIAHAVCVLQILIDDFGVANMFGRKNIRYFADKTEMGIINIKEKYRYEFQFPPPGDSVPYSECVVLFARVMQEESRQRGFDLYHNAISEEDFYSTPARGRSDTKGSQDSGGLESQLMPSSPPSPKSLQQQGGDQHYNPHKKLTHMSSLSAPEVNQGCDTPMQDLSATKRMYLSTSLSRFERVKQRQIFRMKKRSNWFLGPTPNTSVSIESESVLGSREASVGKSSMDATSSDALASDVTASDGGLSDTQASEGIRLSSDLDCTFDEHCGAPSSEPLQRAHLRQDVLNANHGGGGCTATSTPVKQALHPPSSSSSSSSRQCQGAPSSVSRLPSSSSSAAACSTPRPPTPPQGPLTEREVRYFMVENYYGSSSNSNKQQQQQQQQQQRDCPS